MITASEVRLAWGAWARHYGFSEPYREALVQAMMAFAVQTQLLCQEEPAALLYALGRFPRAFGAEWVRVSRLLILLQAQRSGRPVQIDEPSLRPLLVEIAAKKISPEQVRLWLWERTPPSG